MSQEGAKMTGKGALAEFGPPSYAASDYSKWQEKGRTSPRVILDQVSKQEARGLKNDSRKPAHSTPVRTGPHSVSGDQETLRDQMVLREVTSPSPGPSPPPSNSAISSVFPAGMQGAPRQHPIL